MNPDHLAALVAVIDHGTFEAAARALHVTPSAVSQRIKAMEQQHGRILVVRSTPCRPTDEGEVLLRFARQVAELEADARRDLAPDSTRPRRLTVVVNADSLATWFSPVLAEAGAWHDVTLELVVEQEDHGTQHLRTGAAAGAVTSDPVVVSGCSVEALGLLRYVPVCRADLRDAHTRRGSLDWERLPMIRFDRHDDLQHRLLARLGAGTPQVVHLVPENHAFYAAVCAGLGWGLVSEPQLGDAIEKGHLVALTDEVVDVHLSWQTWRLGSQATTRLTESVRRAARAGLHPPR